MEGRYPVPAAAGPAPRPRRGGPYILRVRTRKSGGSSGQKKTPSRGGRQVVEAGFIQARNLSSSETLIRNQCSIAKPKIVMQPLPGPGRLRKSNQSMGCERNDTQLPAGSPRTPAGPSGARTRLCAARAWHSYVWRAGAPTGFCVAALRQPRRARRRDYRFWRGRRI
jgi:hypothetical protein